MKTIAERAKEYASKKADISLSAIYNDALARIYEEGYVAGATEQKAIDTDKACQWITEHTDIPYEGEFIDDEPVASDYIEWCEKRLECAKAIADAFRQTMED